MRIHDMTQKQFRDLPVREWKEDVEKLDSIVILPSRSRHASGYRYLDFVAVRDSQAICRLAGDSDVLRIDPDGTKKGTSWSIDCLPKSGLLHLWCRRKLTAGSALATFEISSCEVK